MLRKIIFKSRARESKDPMVIRISMRLLDINEIDQQDFSISVTVHMKMAWIDNRIIVEGNHSTTISIDVDFIQNIWIPDFYFYDLYHFRNLRALRLQGGLRITKQENDDIGFLRNYFYRLTRSLQTISRGSVSG